MQVIRRLGTLAIERRFRLRLDGAEIVGKIDRVNDVGDGEVEVVDYKTGSGKPMRYAYEAYFGPELYDVQLALYYLACQDGLDEEGKPLGFVPRFLSLWYPKDWVWGGMRQDIFSVGRPAGLKEYREKALTTEDLERSRGIVLQAIERIRGGHFEPAPRELPGTCVTRFGSCPHAAVCPHGGGSAGMSADSRAERSGPECRAAAAAHAGPEGAFLIAAGPGHGQDVHRDRALLLAGRPGRRARPDPGGHLQRPRGGRAA